MKSASIACVGLASLLLLSGCLVPGPESGGGVSESSASAEPAAEPAAEEEPEPSPSPTASEAPEPSPTEAAPELGSQVESAALDSAGVSAFTDMPNSPVVAVTEFEDVNSETVRVYVQDSLDDTAKDDVARWLFNMTCEQVPEVEVFVVRDLSGVDSNHYAGQLSNLPACQ